MHFQGKLKGNLVISLVDSRSTHSFVDSKLVSQFNFQVKRRDGLRIVVENGERVRNLGQCKEVPVWFGNHAFLIDLYALNLSGFDVVLGVNWLKTLGPIYGISEACGCHSLQTWADLGGPKLEKKGKISLCI